jgi:hypothetical protein
MFDICAICANENEQGRCTKPGDTCDEASDFVLKPVYQAAPDMYEALKQAVAELEAIIDGGDWHTDSLALRAATEVLAKVDG